MRSNITVHTHEDNIDQFTVTIVIDGEVTKYTLETSSDSVDWDAETIHTVMCSQALLKMGYAMYGDPCFKRVSFDSLTDEAYHHTFVYDDTLLREEMAVQMQVAEWELTRRK